MEFLILILFYFIVGLPLYAIFFSLFQENRMLFTLSFSVLLGFIFFNLFQLFLGHFGLPLTGIHDIVYKGLFVLSSWTLYLMSKSRISLKEILQFDLQFSNYNKLNIFLSALLALFYLYSLKVINTSYFIPWDVFHYWLLDPKIIYETGYLRQGIDLIDIHKDYGSFLSVSISDLYELMGEVKERRAAYFTLLHAFFAGMFIWQGVSKNETFAKIFGFSVLLIVLSAFSWGHWFYSNYTEVQCAFYILMFVYFLVSIPTYEQKAYWLRFLLLLCSLYILVDIKPYFPQAMFLTAIWIVYDWIHYRKQIFKNFKVSYIAPVVVFVILLFVSGNYYTSNFIEGVSAAAGKQNYYGSGNSLKMIRKVFDQIIPSSYAEGVEIYNLFDNRIDRLVPYFTLLIFSLLSVILISRKDSRTGFVIISMLGIAAIYILYVVFFFPVKENDSFFRYSTLFFFLIPFVTSRKFDLSDQLSKKIIAGCFFGLAILNFFLSSYSPQILSRKNHNGKFDKFPAYAQYQRVAKKVDAYLTPEDKLFVINGNNKVNVRKKSILIIRYNLIQNIVGGIKFQTKKADELKNHLRRNRADYILLHNPTLPFVSELFGIPIDTSKRGSYYLIKINDLENNNFTIIKL